MEPKQYIGIMLIITGACITAAGFVFLISDKIPLLGRLPGDLSFQGRGWSVHVPIATGLLLSLILTIILNILFRR